MRRRVDYKQLCREVFAHLERVERDLKHVLSYEVSPLIADELEGVLESLKEHPLRLRKGLLSNPFKHVYALLSDHMLGVIENLERVIYLCKRDSNALENTDEFMHLEMEIREDFEPLSEELLSVVEQLLLTLRSVHRRGLRYYNVLEDKYVTFEALSK